MVESVRDADKLQVFISYSRDDLAFADQLDEGLRACGFATMIDRHGISGGEDWKRRLGSLIRDADTIAFVLSPSSASSEICAWEVSEAAHLGKRIIPVVCKPLEETSAPPELAELNYIFFYDEPKSPGSGWGAGLARLVTALNTDLAWLREHTRLLQRAIEWDTGGRPENRLLSGADIAAAKNWAATRPKDAPLPTPLHLDFIKASEEWETDKQSQERRRLEEREQLVTAAEEAVKREQAAQSAHKRGRVAIYTLLVGIIAGLIAFINQDILKEQYTWRVVMKPTLLTADEEKEKAANPGPETTFAECENGCPTMVVVPAGKFTRGSSEGSTGHKNERPPRPVTIAKPFAVSRTEITFAEWDACAAVAGCPRLSDNTWGRGDRPAILVSWEEAKQYTAWLSNLTGKTYRLLSEAEWEYAARAGTTTEYSFDGGEAELDAYAWYKINSNARTQPVGKKKPNGFGLHDMHGNVNEWVEDCWHDSYEDAPDDSTAWTNACTDNRGRVIRGGSWYFDSERLRSASRRMGRSVQRWGGIGFRVARTLNR